MPIDLSDENLDLLRHQGDPEADRLAPLIFRSTRVAPDLARRGYNHLLNLSNRLRHAPELYLKDDSILRRELDLYHPDVRDFFDPIAAPDWVDAKLLESGSRVFTTNTVGILLHLYTSSLPHCYAVKNGIPLLYASAGLRDPRMISQRLHETAVFMHDVMSPGGLRVIKDMGHDLTSERLLRDILDDPKTEPALRSDLAALVPRLRASGETGDRYLWGPGFLAIKHVRLLHAAMRYMALNPPQTASRAPSVREADGLWRPRPPWPKEQWGMPVNQEDLAFTLQTFSTVILAGLTRWGEPLLPRERRAFLHVWKVTGYLLGVQQDLLTDDEDEAKEMFAVIARRQQRASSRGKRLTEALLDMLSYILPAKGLTRRILPVMIRAHVGRPVSDMILPRKDRQYAARSYVRLFRSVFSCLVWVYYRAFNVLFGRVRSIEGLAVTPFHRAAFHVVESWRDDVNRKAFTIPGGPSSAGPPDPADEFFANELRRWRGDVLGAFVTAIVCSMVAILSFVLTLVVMFFFPTPTWPWFLLGASIAPMLGLLSAWIIDGMVMERILERRPRLGDQPLSHRPVSG